MIGAPVGVDDEVGGEVGPCRLDQDMHPAAFPCPADRIADDPAHGVTSGDRPWADELLAFLKGDVRHLTRGGIDLIESAFGDRKSTRLNASQSGATRMPSSA